MKIEVLNESTTNKLAGVVRDALYDLSSDALSEVLQEIMNKASLRTLYELMFSESCYEIGVVSDDETDYEWLTESIDTVYSYAEAVKIADNAVSSGNWQGYTVVILNVPDSLIISDRVDASEFEVWRKYVPEGEE